MIPNITDIFQGKNGFWIFLGLIGSGIFLCVIVLFLLFGMAILWGL